MYTDSEKVYPIPKILAYYIDLFTVLINKFVKL
jgi:hypothetical protein